MAEKNKKKKIVFISLTPKPPEKSTMTNGPFIDRKPWQIYADQHGLFAV